MYPMRTTKLEKRGQSNEPQHQQTNRPQSSNPTGRGNRLPEHHIQTDEVHSTKKYLAERIAAPECEHLFVAKNGTSLAVRSVRSIVKKHMQKAGIKKRASVHTLRHTFGT